MKIRKYFAALLAISLLTGCTGTDEPEKAEAIETEEPAVKENIADQYEKLNEDNHFEVTEKETLTSILSHGTAAVFLGFPECPWCQAYIPLLEEVLAEQDALCSYYNIYNDKGSDREFYDSVADLLVSQNDTGTDIIDYDNDGKPTIYMPLVLFVEKGRIVAFDNETCMEDGKSVPPDHYWTKDKKAALKERLSEYVKSVKEMQAQNDSRGCDTGCKVGD